MPTTVHRIKGNEFPPSLQKKFNVKPQQVLTITIETDDSDDFDTVNVGDDIIEGLKQIVAHKKGELKLSPYDEFKKELEHEA